MGQVPRLTRTNADVITVRVGLGIELSGHWGIVVNPHVAEIKSRQVLEPALSVSGRPGISFAIVILPTVSGTSVSVGLVRRNELSRATGTLRKIRESAHAFAPLQSEERTCSHLPI
jgi:hypothetical protein